MKRNICIVNDKFSGKAPNTESVNISEINNIVNCSADYIVCYVLEYVDPNLSDNIIKVLLEKLRPGGYLLIAFTDFKFLSEKYSQSLVSDKDYMSNVFGKTNILSIEKITSCIVNDKYVVSKIDGEAVLSVTIHRVKP